MKKLLISLLLAALLGTCSLSAYAAPARIFIKFGNAHTRHDYRLREDARYIIHRTAIVLYDAQRSAEYGHHYFGLGRAITNQQKARELYENGSYQESIFSSLRARNLAIQIIEQNHERPRREFYRDEMEEDYSYSAPRDDELAPGIAIAKIGRDEEAVHIKFGLDLN